MILWENIKNPELKGKARGKEHFNRLNKLANNNLRQIDKISEEAIDIVEEILEESEETSSDTDK